MVSNSTVQLGTISVANGNLSCLASRILCSQWGKRSAKHMLLDVDFGHL